MVKTFFYALLLYCTTFLFSSTVVKAQSPAYWNTCYDVLASQKQNTTCSQQAIVQYILQALQDSTLQISGTFVIKYTIDEQGAIVMVEILKSPDESLNNKIMQIIRSFPNFHPAQDKEGNAIISEYTLPIRFQIEETLPYEEEKNYTLHWGNIYANTLTLDDLQYLMTQNIELRDIYGNTYSIREIEMNVIHGLDVKTAKAYKTEKPSNSMRKKFRKVAIGSTLVLNVLAETGEAGQRIKMTREYEIIK